MAAKLCRESVSRPARTGRQGVFRLCTVSSLPRSGYSQKVYLCGIAAVRSPVYNKCRAHSCVSPPDYRTIQIKEHPYVNQQPVHSRLRPFFPQRRGTSHSRHGADADGSSLGDPPARAGLADVCRTAGLPHLRIHGGGRIFSHPQLPEIRPATCAVCRALRSAIRPDVRRNLVLSGAPERDLDAAARSSEHSSDGNRAQKAKDMAVSAHRPACCADRHSAGHPEHGGLLRHRRADDLYLLLLPRTEVVVSGRTASRPLLGQCAAAGRSAVSRPYIRHGI